MNNSFSQYSLIEYGHLDEKDFEVIKKCRGEHNVLGFTYQLIFTKLLNRLPFQAPLEIVEEIVIYASMQLSLDDSLIVLYGGNRKKIFSHQKIITSYLQLNAFDDSAQELLKDFIFQQALQFEPISLLQIKSVEFLRKSKILLPAEDTLLRVVKSQRATARQLLFDKIHTYLSPSTFSI